MAMQSALERYEDIDYTFSGSREGKLLKVWDSCGFIFTEQIHSLQSCSPKEAVSYEHDLSAGFGGSI
jgi:hypothetical protein